MRKNNNGFFVAFKQNIQPFSIHKNAMGTSCLIINIQPTRKNNNDPFITLK